MPSKVVVAEATYIDPADCDSLVAYKIVWESYDSELPPTLRATVTLTDCSRSIDWYFGNGDTKRAIEKIDTAIRALTAFKKKFAVELKKDPKLQ